MSIFARNQKTTRVNSIFAAKKIELLSTENIFSGHPKHTANLFTHLGPNLIADKQLLKRAAITFENLSDEYKLLFNAMYGIQKNLNAFALCHHLS